MADREALTDRVRQALAHLPSVKEQRMTGGLAFMVNRKLCVGVYGKGGDLMLRCDPATTDELLTKKGARWAEMGGKPMAKGWVLVSDEGITNQEDFQAWIAVALDYNSKQKK